MVTEEKYRVVFNSREIEKRYRRRAKRQMAKKFRLNRKKVNLLFSYRQFTIKKNISFQEAVRLQLVVEKTGGVCEIRPMIRKPVSLQGHVNRESPQTESLSNANKTVSSWYDHVTETIIPTEELHYSGHQLGKYRRQVEDRRSEQDRRLAIRLEIDRRKVTDRREENRIWKGNWRK